MYFVRSLWNTSEIMEVLGDALGHMELPSCDSWCGRFSMIELVRVWGKALGGLRLFILGLCCFPVPSVLLCLSYPPTYEEEPTYVVSPMDWLSPFQAMSHSLSTPGTNKGLWNEPVDTQRGQTREKG